VFRPHFKTHQSAAVADWFRQAGVTCATVSSPGMASYFADHRWGDLTLAIGANPLQTGALDALAGRLRLGLTIDDQRTLDALVEDLHHPVAFWIEVDTGQHRGGIAWDDHARLVDLARGVLAGGESATTPAHTLAGLLTHGGQSYQAATPEAAAAVFATVRERLQTARQALLDAGLPPLEISAGDTPAFAASADWSGLDEARPGNFVFYDLMQLTAGACDEDDLACAVACPVIGVYPQRDEVLLHAGSVHLSCESLTIGGRTVHGRLLGLDPTGFTRLVPGWEIAGLSQEHGRLRARSPQARAELPALQPGDLVLVAPVHACLTCEQFSRYWTLDGQELPRYRRR
jgi:D-serine deaminase-like pyridoxal phosphate-dependent protein